MANTGNYTEAIDALLEAVDLVVGRAVGGTKSSVSVHAAIVTLQQRAQDVRDTAAAIETTLGASLAERRQGMGPDVAEPITVPADAVLPVTWEDDGDRRRPAGQVRDRRRGRPPVRRHDLARTERGSLVVSQHYRGECTCGALAGHLDDCPAGGE